MAFLIGFCLGAIATDFLLLNGKFTKGLINKIRSILNDIKNSDKNSSKID